MGEATYKGRERKERRLQGGGREERWDGKGGRGERSLFTMSEYNKYIYKLDSGRLPERNNHHSWPPTIIEKNNH